MTGGSADPPETSRPLVETKQMPVHGSLGGIPGRQGGLEGLHPNPDMVKPVLEASRPMQ